MLEITPLLNCKKAIIFNSRTEEAGLNILSDKTKKENLIVINGDTLIDFSRTIFIKKVTQNKEAIL